MKASRQLIAQGNHLHAVAYFGILYELIDAGNIRHSWDRGGGAAAGDSDRNVVVKGSFTIGQDLKRDLESNL